MEDNCCRRGCTTPQYAGSVNFFSLREVSLIDPITEGPTYVFRSFPDGYGFFDHNKGIQSAPRHDLYLYGMLVATYSAPHPN